VVDESLEEGSPHPNQRVSQAPQPLIVNLTKALRHLTATDSPKVATQEGSGHSSGERKYALPVNSKAQAFLFLAINPTIINPDPNRTKLIGSGAVVKLLETDVRLEVPAPPAALETASETVKLVGGAAYVVGVGLGVTLVAVEV